MALTDDNGLVMPVAPMYGGGGNGGNSNGWGDNGWWILLLFLALFGGWGNNNNGYGGGGNGGGNMFPSYYLANNTDNGVQRGFDTATITSQLNGIQSSISNGFATAEIGECNRAMTAMQQSFANAQALDSRLDALGSSLANCCCENRLATADLRYTIATEACNDRQAINTGVRDIIANQTASTQMILDKLCQQEIDALKERNASLQTEINLANLRASQIAQTAEIQRGQVAEVDALYQRLRDCPVPTQPVYGSQPIFTCPNNNMGCGCGCGNNF